MSVGIVSVQAVRCSRTTYTPSWWRSCSCACRNRRGRTRGPRKPCRRSRRHVAPDAGAHRVCAAGAASRVPPVAVPPVACRRRGAARRGADGRRGRSPAAGRGRRRATGLLASSFRARRRSSKPRSPSPLKSTKPLTKVQARCIMFSSSGGPCGPFSFSGIFGAQRPGPQRLSNARTRLIDHVDTMIDSLATGILADRGLFPASPSGPHTMPPSRPKAAERRWVVRVNELCFLGRAHR